MAMVGYARVSTQDQQTALQRDALRAHGVQQVFVEAGSGVGPRPELQRAISRLGGGDTLVVWKLDRVARSLADLLSINSRLKSAGASIRSLTEPLDTSSPFGEFTFQVLGAVAQLERSMIRERVMAGQEAARARGKRWGPPRALSVDDEAELVTRYLAGGITMPELALAYGVGIGVVKGAVYRVTRPDAPMFHRRVRP